MHADVHGCVKTKEGGRGNELGVRTVVKAKAKNRIWRNKREESLPGSELLSRLWVALI
jgi:hypothetical protein